MLRYTLATLLVTATAWTQVVAQNTISTTYGNGHCAITAGYVCKDWICSEQGHRHHQGFGQDAGLLLHGAQLGISYADSFGHSCLGWQAQADVEYYTTSRGFVEQSQWDKFVEYSLHPQLLLTCRLRCSQHCAITPHAGIGANWAALGYYSDVWYLHLLDNSLDLDHLYSLEHYGNDIRPQRFNLQMEYGCSFSYERFVLRATYAYGLTNHSTRQNQHIRQNKLSVSLGFIISKPSVR